MQLVGLGSNGSHDRGHRVRAEKQPGQVTSSLQDTTTPVGAIKNPQSMSMLLDWGDFFL